jgi:hypothetical protein
LFSITIHTTCCHVAGWLAVVPHGPPDDAGAVGVPDAVADGWDSLPELS